MATTSNLGTVHVFDTIDKYNANASSVGSSDLALVPMNGEIVAQSLGENGYVKFANGLIMQWGYYGSIGSEKNVTVTLPIAFERGAFWVQCATPTKNTSSRGVVGAMPNDTTTVILTNGNSAITDVRWFAIGY